MNRRTFLKTVGAAVAVVSVPAIAKPKQEPKWISFAEDMPKVGQKIIIASHVSVLGSICGGVVTELPDSSYSKYASLSTIDDFYIGYTGGFPIGIFYSEEGKDILSTRDWIRERESIVPRDYTECNQPPSYYIGYNVDTYYWLAVDGEYPKEIPPIPRNPIFDELEKR